MEAIKISLDDYVLSGGGANGESFDHKTDPSVMLKLYFPGKIQQPLDEMMVARQDYAAGKMTVLSSGSLANTSLPRTDVTASVSNES